MVWICDNCTSKHCFIHDSHSDTYVCTNCGRSYDGLAPPTDDGTVPESVVSAKREFKGSYRRVAHITERLKSSICEDPAVPPDVLELIREEWEKRQKLNYFARLRAAQKIVKKSDIRQILRSLDLRYLGHLDQVPFFSQILRLNPKSTLNFSTVFLERWKSIGSELTGTQPIIYSYSQAMKVGAMLTKISSIWDYWQPPSRKADGSFLSFWKFKDRKHIPNLNFLFQRVHELCGPEYRKFDTEFPIPTNPQALRRLWRYWKELARAANVPFRGVDRGQGFTEPVFKQLKITNFNKLNSNSNSNVRPIS